MVDLNPYNYRATVDLSEVCGWLGTGCFVLGAASLANSPLIPDEIPAAAECTAAGGVCSADFILDTYGDSLCENPSFAIYTAPWYMPPPLPQVIAIPRC